MKKMKNSKGFTLMEMLIVVAIIAILVAIAMPVFTNQLEKARQVADIANIRSAYAEAMVKYMNLESEGTASVDTPQMQHKDGNWDKIEWPAYLNDGTALSGSVEKKVLTVTIGTDGKATVAVKSGT